VKAITALFNNLEITIISILMDRYPDVDTSGVAAWFDATYR